MSDYDSALQRHRRAAEAKKSAADKLRDRLRYVDQLRQKSAAAARLADRLNEWMQGSNPKESLVLRWARQTLTVTLGRRTMVLDRTEVDSLFTWAFDHSVKVAANADRIEAELEGAPH